MTSNASAAFSFAANCQVCGAAIVTHDGVPQTHYCMALDVERHRAKQAGWEEGYRFALDNISDPLVQADKGEFGSGWVGLIRQGGVEVEMGEEPPQIDP